MKKIMERRLFQWLRAAMLVCATVWVVSCSNDDNAVIEPADGPGAAYRAVLRGLDWGPDTTFVYGHKTPDVDAVCSALGYARLMRALGYNCKANNEGFDYNVTHALYLDMGRGWNYAWYRIRKGR